MTRFLKLTTGSALLAGALLLGACHDDQGTYRTTTPQHTDAPAPVGGTPNPTPSNSNR